MTVTLEPPMLTLEPTELNINLRYNSGSTHRVVMSHNQGRMLLPQHMATESGTDETGTVWCGWTSTA